MDISSLLAYGVQQQASDLHLSPGQQPMLRIHGNLHAFNDSVALSADEVKKLIYNVVPLAEQQALEIARELDMTLHLANNMRFRMHVFYQAQGMAAVFRLLPTSLPSLQSPAFPSLFTTLLTLKHGLILIAGSTGSGKSTTLAAMIHHLNQHQACHIITIEDPIEFLHSSQKGLVNQRQVNRDTHDFTSALRSALRQDPDIIVLGEMRDSDTLRLALSAAETGHLVMATLHTSSAPRAISRIVEAFSASEKDRIRKLLADSLQAVIYQTLVKNKTGGRTPAFEIMLGTPAIRNLIREDKIAQLYSVMQTNTRLGMCTLDHYLQDLVAKAILSPAMAREAAVNVASFHERREVTF
jgi:twitching motility protein PilT